MGQVSYYECDKCGQKLDKERESSGAISISAGSTVASLCTNCQMTTTVFDSKLLARKLVEGQRAGWKGKQT